MGCVCAVNVCLRGAMLVHDVVRRILPVPMPGKPEECVIEERALEYRDGDVCIVTFPKTGTTLVQYLCHLLRTRGLDDRFDDIHQVCPQISSSWFIGQRLNDPAALHNAHVPRLFKSHRELEQVAALTTAHVKFIVTLRNPLHTLHSMFDFRTKRGSTRSEISLLEFAQSPFWTTEKVDGCIKTIFDHFVTFWRCRHCSNILILPYENLTAQPATYVPIIARFMGVECSPELVETIVTKATREAMLGIMHKFDESWCREQMMRLGRYNVNIGTQSVSKVNRVESIVAAGDTQSNGSDYSAKEGEEAQVAALQEQLWAEKVYPLTGLRSYDEMRRAVREMYFPC